MGFDKSKSKTDPTTQSVWGVQEPYLKELYSRSAEALPGALQNWQGVQEQMQGALSGMMGFSPNNPALQSYANQAREAFHAGIFDG